MKIIINTVLAFVCVIALCSCASYGNNFKEQNLSTLKAGTTTYSQVCTILGSKPTMKINVKGGSHATWQYTSAVYTSVTENKLLAIQFDENDVMIKVVSATNIDIPASQRKQLGM